MSDLLKDAMRPLAEVRLMIFRMLAFGVETQCITVAEWPEKERSGWLLFAIDPDDEIAYTYWHDQGGPSLRHFT